MASSRDYHGNIRAPEFPAGLDWLNTAHPLTLASLRGKLVLLDFWTYGCINCIHVVPDLKRLEAEFPEALVVIGVHSAKFTNEGQTENLRQIILRYELTHPVVNDRDYRVWQSYAVRAWPTTVLISPEGRVLAAHSGEGVYEAYHDLLAEAIAEYDRRGLLDREPIEFALEREGVADTTLRFPGKVLADGEGGRLFIADSNHHRIVVTDLDGTVLAVIGSGVRGLADGSFEQTRFSQPQGMALVGDTLYIADTENHALRAADLAERRVRTVTGDGQQARYRKGGEVDGTQLNSPWDLAAQGGRLYIAMAGFHQIWVYDPADGVVEPYAGSGREALTDGLLRRSTLAQPSGIASDGQRLYVADSESSAVRVIDEAREPQVRTVIGQGLFEFGDIDGAYPRARLQHDLGITVLDGRVYIADTYNHKIKRVDTEVDRVEIFAGTGKPGYADGRRAQFWEPGGISGAGRTLYVADQNNHAVRTVDVDTGGVGTLTLRDPDGLLTRR